MNKKNIEYIIVSFMMGVLLAISFVFGLSVVQAQGAKNLGDPWDGAEKSWQMGTVIDAAFVYVTRDENMPPNFQFEFGDRVYVQYEVDGYYFVEKYYECLPQPIYGWVWHKHILLDADVKYSE